MVIHLHPTGQPRASGSNTRFKQLLRDLEAQPETREELAAARKELSAKLYPAKGLAALRLDAGLSQAELARRLNIQQSHVSRYEAGRAEPGIDKAADMACALGVGLEAFHQAWRVTTRAAE